MSAAETNISLPAFCDIAFKEWASICQALAAGRQTIILRKGGISEGREGFRVEHRHFWLFPTRFHQNPAELSADGAAYLSADVPEPTDSAGISLDLFAQVEQVNWIESEERLAPLADFHIWSQATLHERFHYKKPGLFLLIVRCFRVASPHFVENRAEYAGCKSWVPLGASLPTQGAMPVVSDGLFADRIATLRAKLG